MASGIWRYPDLGGYFGPYPQINHPDIRALGLPQLHERAMTSRWKPVRTTISGEAWRKLVAVAVQHDMSVREVLEGMIHHGLSGIYRPGSWEANGPFYPEQYRNGGTEPTFADRWFQ